MMSRLLYAALSIVALSSAANAQSVTAERPWAMAQSEAPGANSPDSTSGAAPADVPTPPVTTHIPSGSDAAKFNAAADADDKILIMARAVSLTPEQRRLISSALAGEDKSGPHADFEPQISALMPPSAIVKDLPGEVTTRIPRIERYKYALVDNKILLVDPVNSYIVLDIIDR